MPAAFRLYSKMDTQFGLSGQLLSGGYLKFYDAGTTTPKNVYGELALSTNNGATVDLDASGRPDVDVWGSGSYFVELYDADDVKQGEADDVQIPGGDATALPVLGVGEYLTGDGSGNYIGVDISGSLLPDPTGHPNEYLQTDGTDPFWADGPTDGAAGADGADPIGDGDIQSGTVSVSSSGTKAASASVTFATAFASAPVVVCTVKGSAPTSSGAYPKLSVTSISTTGFTVTGSTLTGGTSADNQAGSSITSGFDVFWQAVGTAA